MIAYPNIDPVAVSLGPLKIHWYGLMYLAGFAAAWWLGKRRAAMNAGEANWKEQEIGDLIFYCALGVILGGRLGHTLFYDFSGFLANPLQLFMIWQGGMSFHGGLLGVISAMWLYGRRTQRHFFQVADFVAPLVPIGLATGRLGNFINGELWGRVSDVPWAMIFPDPRAGAEPRHPSQLYELLLEGVALFFILWLFAARPRPMMAVSGLFLAGYGVFRIFVEFFRTPDAHIGFLAGNWLTLGMLLSAPMVIGGIALMALAYYNERNKPATS